MLSEETTRQENQSENEREKDWKAWKIKVIFSVFVCLLFLRSLSIVRLSWRRFSLHELSVSTSPIENDVCLLICLNRVCFVKYSEVFEEFFFRCVYFFLFSFQFRLVFRLNSLIVEFVWCELHRFMSVFHIVCVPIDKNYSIFGCIDCYFSVVK